MTDWPAWATEVVELCPADPAWHSNGARERAALEVSLARWLVMPVEHVGSTAVPGLPAKPIIDLQAAVLDFDVTTAMAEQLAPDGWHHVSPELDQRPWRRFFVKTMGDRRTAHLHVMVAGTARWDEQLSFRNALRADSGLVDAYASLKRDLAARHRSDRERYTAGKSAFVRAVLERDAT